MNRAATMPRYFFHQCINDRMIWDGAGLQLPDFKLAPDADWAAGVWADIIAGRLQPDQITVETDESGKVLFVAAG